MEGKEELEVLNFYQLHSENFNYVSIDTELPDASSELLPVYHHIVNLINKMPRKFITMERLEQSSRILMPTEMQCCNKRLRIDSRPTSI